MMEPELRGVLAYGAPETGAASYLCHWVFSSRILCIHSPPLHAGIETCSYRGFLPSAVVFWTGKIPTRGPLPLFPEKNETMMEPKLRGGLHTTPPRRGLRAIYAIGAILAKCYVFLHLPSTRAGFAAGSGTGYNGILGQRPDGGVGPLPANHRGWLGRAAGEESWPVHRVPLDIHVGDRVRMRKPHPCGGYEWQITRIGADIGLVCLTCGRRVMLPRSKFEKRVKTILKDQAEAGA